MVVICKRFGLDDVPVKLLDCDLTKGVLFARGAVMMFRGKDGLATRDDQQLVHADIGTTCLALLVVEFDGDGDAVKSEVVPVD